MDDHIELVMYGRTTFCPYQRIAERVLSEYSVSYRSIMIDREPWARDLVLEWTGFLSVPTFVITHPGGDLPTTPPTPLNGVSPRGVDRGTMLTEAREEELLMWLRKHGLLSA